jgi:phosphonoacetaldehyde hydrolase
MKQIEAVIFDWAGTTVDYGCMAPIYAMQEAFATHKLVITLDEIRKPMGMLKIDHIKAVLDMERVKIHFHEAHHRQPSNTDVQEIYNDFEKNIFDNLHLYTQLIEGVLTVQDYLRQHKIKIGSTTGYTRDMLHIVADSAKQQGYAPDCTVTADEVKRGRPYGYMLHQNIAALDVLDTHSVVKVGDTIVDIQEGLYAGCWSVGVVKGSSMLGLSETEVSAMPAHELSLRMRNVRYQMLYSGAHFVIDSIDELPWVIELIHAKMNSGRQITKEFAHAV